MTDIRAELAALRDSRRCFTCGQVKPLDAFRVDRRRNMGRAGVCKQCVAVTARQNSRRFRDRHLESERVRERSVARQMYERHRERKLTESRSHNGRTRTALRNAVAAGQIARPSTCHECGGAGQIHAHHQDYSKPFDVEWLCSRCHGLRHRKEEGAA